VINMLIASATAVALVTGKQSPINFPSALEVFAQTVFLAVGVIIEKRTDVPCDTHHSNSGVK